MKFLKIPSCLLLIPGLVAAQNQGQLPLAAKKLLKHPQLGLVRLTQTGHPQQSGVIQRVTNQFVTFRADAGSCENIDLQNLIDVDEPASTAAKLSGGDFFGTLIFVAVVSPFLLAAIIAEPFRRLSPPLHPLNGNWVTHENSRDSLRFTGDHVSGFVTTILRRGRYSVEQDRLHLVPDSRPPLVVPFKFDCSMLRLDGERPMALDAPFFGVTAPIVGNWRDGFGTLTFRPDGSFIETKTEAREGTFQMSANRALIHWRNNEEWTARIELKHLEILRDGVVTKYRYDPGNF